MSAGVIQFTQQLPAQHLCHQIARYGATCLCLLFSYLAESLLALLEASTWSSLPLIHTVITRLASQDSKASLGLYLWKTQVLCLPFVSQLSCELITKRKNGKMSRIIYIYVQNERYRPQRAHQKHACYNILFRSRSPCCPNVCIVCKFTNFWK